MLSQEEKLVFLKRQERIRGSKEYKVAARRYVCTVLLHMTYSLFYLSSPSLLSSFKKVVHIPMNNDDDDDDDDDDDNDKLKRWTSTMVALPIALVTSWVLWRRIFGSSDSSTTAGGGGGGAG